VGDDSVRIGGGSYPYVRKGRAEARRSARLLTATCGCPVEVRPLLVFVDVAGLTVVPSPRDVMGGEPVEAVHGAARHRGTWVGA
jgi:hypothetical protein